MSEYDDRNRRPWAYRADPYQPAPRRWVERPPYGARWQDQELPESDFLSGSSEPQYFGTGRYGSTPDFGTDPGDRIDAYRDFLPPAGPARGARRGPKGYVRSDERIKEDLSERLLRSHELDVSDVTVDVQDGKVTLTGTVPERFMKHRIEDLADACPGVRDIDNRMRVR